MANSQVSTGFRTFTAGETLAAFRRVKWSAQDTVVYADAGEDFDAITQEAAASGDPVNCKLKNQAGTMLIESAGAVTAGAAVYGANDGKVDDVVAGETIGKANEAASGAGVAIEILPAAGQTVQQSHIADPAAMASLTSAALTENSGAIGGTNDGDLPDLGSNPAALTENSGAIGGTNDGDLPALVDPAGDSGASVIAGIRENATKINELVADVTNLIAAVRENATGHNEVRADVAAAKTAIDANNAAIDAILAAQEALGHYATS